MGTRPSIPNPLSIPGARPLLLFVDGIGLWLFAIAAVGSATSLVVRFRRARGKQRQQLKWLAYAVTVLVATIAISETAFPAATVAAVVALATVAFIPVAIGVAILRHQLFDIDRVINRPFSREAVVRASGQSAPLPQAGQGPSRRSRPTLGIGPAALIVVLLWFIPLGPSTARHATTDTTVTPCMPSRDQAVKRCWSRRLRWSYPGLG
jgi:hypothetical protein